MGYRYKHNGWSNREYRALIWIGSSYRYVTYSSCFGLNMHFNFMDLKDKVFRLFGVEISKKDIIDRKLLADCYK